MVAERAERPYHHGNVRADLIRVALRVLKTQGASGVKLTDLAKAIGVSTPAVYNHFRNKEAVLAAIAVEGYRRLIARGRKALAAAAPQDRLRALAITYLRFAVEEPNLYRLMFQREIKNRRLYPDLIAAEDEAFELSGLIFYPEIDRNRRSQDYPLAFLPWATLHGVAMLIADQQMTPRNAAELDAIAAQVVETHLPK